MWAWRRKVAFVLASAVYRKTATTSNDGKAAPFGIRRSSLWAVVREDFFSPSCVTRSTELFPRAVVPYIVALAFSVSAALWLHEEEIFGGFCVASFFRLPGWAF